MLYDKSIEQGSYHIYDYLVLCAENGVTLHPKKFKFTQKTVDFSGYTIVWDDYRPSDDLLSALNEFPMSESPSITDVRAWFGLVNQLAPFLATAPLMAPFRDLLKSPQTPGKKVYWDDQLQKIFETTREEICKLASQGLTF